METKFRKVTVGKADTCLSYVLKRIGEIDSWDGREGKEFVKQYQKTRIESLKDLAPGTIIYVERPKETVFNTFTIDEEGRLFYGDTENNVHFMLMERGLISDMSAAEGIPYIRVRELSSFDLHENGSTWYSLQPNEALRLGIEVNSN